jgi:tetratricopeptide (TPR) repeat protein
VRLLGVLCCLMTVAGVPAQQAPEEFTRLLEKGQASEGKDNQAALHAYRAAHDLAKSRNVPEAQAEAGLSAALMIESLFVSKPDRLAEAVDLYAEASATGTPAQRRVAFNNAGALQLRLGHNQQALDSFAKIDFAGADPAAAILFRFNYGRALEQNGKIDEAAQQYSAALELDPKFLPAVRGAAAISRSPVSATSLCASVFDKGGAEAARECVHSALPALASQPGAAGLLHTLVRSYVALKVDTKSFEQNEAALFDEVKQKAPPGCATWKGGV